MSINNQPEVWLRGPLPGMPLLLQPIAHALMQSKEEVRKLMNDFPDALLWIGVAGLASPAFHLQHMAGVLDRLFTYAAGMPLTEQQLHYLAQEGKQDKNISAAQLTEFFYQAVDTALLRLMTTDESTLTQLRGVGRQQLPSTLIGLLTHAAEHTMRHTGQLLVTVKVVVAGA